MYFNQFVKYFLLPIQIKYTTIVFPGNFYIAIDDQDIHLSLVCRHLKICSILPSVSYWGYVRALICSGSCCVVDYCLTHCLSWKFAGMLSFTCNAL